MKISSIASCTLPSAGLLLALATPIAAESAPNPSSAKAPPPAAVEDVRVQPRGQEFMPNSAEDQATQRRQSIFNEQQGIDNAEFDRKLKICRGC
ncbi:hypothetical protein CI1B_44490 [Bradyrhizobium ivorense]|uniref:Uncharacterized protein n=1 Tax=Bradyrhizobium ivorense TaxID=2511166 RepID=A0A508TED8_9BRAD|nr:MULTISPECIES: hypothetical protein [Bradyrhizobium]VIO72801.1 hypothetical protein CI1B_44490 [Bradyrhizobium ivorense]